MSRKGRIGCSHCNWKGYKKYPFWNGEKEEITVTLCSSCKDVRGYSAYVKNKYGKLNKNNVFLIDGSESLADVIDFDKYRDSNELQYINQDECERMAERQFEEFGEIPRMDKENK
jgi:hypothetical protein